MSAEYVEVDCGEVCTIMQTMDIFAQLSVAYDEQKKVVVDVSKISKVDTAVLQLLYNFQQDAIARELAVEWTEATAEFKQSVALLGMPAFYNTAVDE